MCSLDRCCTSSMNGPMGSMMMILVLALALCLFHAGRSPVLCGGRKKILMEMVVAHILAIIAAPGPFGVVSRAGRATLTVGAMIKSATTRTTKVASQHSRSRAKVSSGGFRPLLWGRPTPQLFEKRPINLNFHV